MSAYSFWSVQLLKLLKLQEKAFSYFGLRSNAYLLGGWDVRMISPKNIPTGMKSIRFGMIFGAEDSAEDGRGTGARRPGAPPVPRPSAAESSAPEIIPTLG